MSDRIFERSVREWLEDGSDRTPRHAIDAVLLAVKTTPQERDLRIPRRFTTMPMYLRLAAAVAVIAVAAFGALTLLGNGPGVGSSTPPTTPAPATTTAPTTAQTIDTSAWTTYTSDRYGVTIKHPPEWTEVPADHDWTWETDIDDGWMSTGFDSFTHQGSADGLGVKVSVWSADEGVYDAPTWLERFCAGLTVTDNACAGIKENLVPVRSADGVFGVLGQQGPVDTIAAFCLDEPGMYVVALWRPENDPAVRPYGGARRLLEAFLSTMTLPGDAQNSTETC